jgi:CheY-like chemotaxis protein
MSLEDDTHGQRETIISRPIKFSSLVRAMLPDPDAMDQPMISKTEKSKKKVNRRMSQDKPLAILLVDDNAVNVTVGKRILELFGYKTVTSASDGQQAIEIAEKRQFDLILLDLQMPVLDGFSAQERIKASPLAGEPCIVALTANADKETQQSCREAGFFDYLSKPLDIPRLETILGEVWDWRQKRRLTGANGEKGDGEAMDKAENVNINETLEGHVGTGLGNDEKTINDLEQEGEMKSAKGNENGDLKKEEGPGERGGEVKKEKRKSSDEA